MDDQLRRQAIDNLRYGGPCASGPGLIGGINPARTLTQEEAEKLYAEQEAQFRKWQRQSNRQQALGHVLGLGRRYDNADEAIQDATIIAHWLGLDID